ncbi:MAG: RNA polymerase sigma factor [Oscillospiraceae bacterium]
MKVENLTDETINDVIQKYKNTVYGLAFTNTGNKHDAEDIFQEVFLLYFTKGVHFDNETARKMWLVRTTVNKCRQSKFSTWNMRVDKLENLDDIQTVEFESSEESSVYTAVMELPENYRLPVYLYYFIGMPVKEIAAVLHVRSNTVNVRMTRARNILKEKLKEDYFNEK